MVTLIDQTRIRHPEKAHRPDSPVLRKPDWIRVRAPGSPVYRDTQQIVREHNLVTVCEEAGCPNIGECWSQKHATMMIMGEICTRACAFCNVATGLPTLLDPLEPEHVAEAVKKLGSSDIDAAFMASPGGGGWDERALAHHGLRFQGETHTARRRLIYDTRGRVRPSPARDGTEEQARQVLFPKAFARSPPCRNVNAN